MSPTELLELHLLDWLGVLSMAVQAVARMTGKAEIAAHNFFLLDKDLGVLLLRRGKILIQEEHHLLKIQDRKWDLGRGASLFEVRMHGLGITRLVVVGVRPLGCMPLVKTLMEICCWDAVNNPKKYGLAETSEGCCGTGTVEYGDTCKGMSTCADASKYVFWDAVHPTEKMNPSMNRNLRKIILSPTFIMKLSN
ncbi:GDSL esterase/lipase EXL3-like [Durio zibethinus]|uniref:GDSL esterase/lipase EXL3-like n=1 Tax=Durio zibethinus TaxID=66656 RepID=A0A6P5XK30_DURZI|nr:GDSL esterase/lipase EXL3-like [Durio zibethinus]